MNNAPIFVGTPKSPAVRISTGNTNRDGATGSYATLLTAGANGAFYKSILVVAEGTVTAGVVRIFKQDGGSGNVELWKELLISAVTPGASQEVATAEWAPTSGIVLSPGTVLKVSTHNSETFGVHAMGGGDY